MELQPAIGGDSSISRSERGPRIPDLRQRANSGHRLKFILSFRGHDERNLLLR